MTEQGKTMTLSLAPDGHVSVTQFHFCTRQKVHILQKRLYANKLHTCWNSQSAIIKKQSLYLWPHIKMES